MDIPEKIVALVGGMAYHLASSESLLPFCTPAVSLFCVDGE